MRPTDEERMEIVRRLRSREWRKCHPICVLNQIVFGGDCRDDCDDFETNGCEECEFSAAYRLSELIEPAPVNGSTSDGYHTFDELYDHRAKLFSVIVKTFEDRAWKSLEHADGTMYDGMFVVGIETPSGQATYHYDVDPYWSIFDCQELDAAPEWDGHTPSDAIERIAALADLIEAVGE